MKKLLFLFSLLLSLISTSKDLKVNTGYWHTNFQLNPTLNLPVIFQFEQNNKLFSLAVLNADERIILTDVLRKNDSLFIKFPLFDSELKLKVVKKDLIRGAWFNYNKGKNYFIPLISTHGYQDRFPNQPKTIDVGGKWEVTFDYKSDPEKAIGLFNSFHQKKKAGNNKISGTFLTETGDYRFLDGVVSNDSIYLSTFDGSHAFLFRARLVNDTLWGSFNSGKHYETNWYATKNERFELTHPDSLTFLVNKQPIQLQLKDLENQDYVYPNTQTKGKVTLIQIMGTWCPNCLDESRYLASLKAQYKDQLEIIAITFETQESVEDRIAKVKKYKESLDLNFTFLMGGKACKTCAAELFPMFNAITSFPTLIFINKKGEIKNIHTGFSGPGTGVYYEKFVEKTNLFIEQLINE